LDIKPSNILITSNATDDPNESMPFSIKISDFGMAVSRTSEEVLDHLSSSFTRSIIGIDREGDRVYVAKEIITESKYSIKCDIFSLGLTMLETSFNVLLPCEGSLWHTLRDQEFRIDVNQVRLMPANEKVLQGIFNLKC
jgi:mitosis inhibitor protein kinase SWE1